MKTIWTNRLVAGIGALALAACDGGGTASDGASAQVGNAVETLGTVTASLEGEDRTWYITRAELGGETVSQSDYSELGSMYSVSILAHATPNTAMNTTGALAFGFDITDPDAATIEPASPTLEYLRGGLTDMLTDDDPDITITSFETGDGMLRMSGTFNADVSDRQGSETLNITDGAFEAALYPVQ